MNKKVKLQSVIKRYYGYNIRNIDGNGVGIYAGKHLKVKCDSLEEAIELIKIMQIYKN